MIKKTLFGLALCLTPMSDFAQTSKTVEKAAAEVIARFTDNKVKPNLRLSMKKRNGQDAFATSVSQGKLTVEGSSGVALCRGFYDFARRQGAGISSWSGKRCDLPNVLKDENRRVTGSPFAHHYYMNVVTFGYSTPYWDATRWDSEIDWMALHGIDMPLALVAQEAITTRVWKKLGLTDEEINGYFVGPAHLPWMRMGNISGIDGPLTASWHSDQIRLQHHILDRMRTLGMTPICPAFAGFVPQAMKRLFPNIKLIETSWAGNFHNWMLSPEEPLFRKIGSMFIKEWEKEFGTCNYYLADSFNEMDIPFPPKGTEERAKKLAAYGEQVYQSIRDGNKQATWVMQGWMFGYQRDIWDEATLKALVSRVPDNRMLLLDLAEDYNHHFWKNGDNWTFYKGFFGKPWIFSVIPNMGGKTAFTGQLEYYANGRLKALRSKDRGNLSGYGLAPEGIENNEMIYELLSDGGWTSDSIDLKQWTRNYAICRYGSFTSELDTCFEALQKSVYGSFTDHPRFCWQFRPQGKISHGSVNHNVRFEQAYSAFFNAWPSLYASPLYRIDLIELTALYAGGKIEDGWVNVDYLFAQGDTAQAHRQGEQLLQAMLATDALLGQHPTHRLEDWLTFARKKGATQQESDNYERNARRIVTVWGPPVDDYSARIWSGLIRDYYIPRWQAYLEEKLSRKPFDYSTWELKWINTKGLSPTRELPSPTFGCYKTPEAKLHYAIESLLEQLADIHM